MKKKTSLSDDPIFQTLVGAITAMLARITNLSLAGSYRQALQEINQELENLVGLKSEELMGLSEAFIIDLLTVNEFLDIQRLWFLAELIRVEGEIKSAQGGKSSGLERQNRALRFFLEAAFASNTIVPQIDTQITALIDRLGVNIPEETLFNLFDYFDRQRNFKKALKALDLMLEKTNNNPQILAEKRTYLLQLLEIPETVLILAGLTHTDIQSKINNISKKSFLHSS